MRRCAKLHLPGRLWMLHIDPAAVHLRVTFVDLPHFHIYSELIFYIFELPFANLFLDVDIVYNKVVAATVVNFFFHLRSFRSLNIHFKLDFKIHFF